MIAPSALNGAATEVVLREGADEANGAAYLLHMLLSQRSAHDSTRFGAVAGRLRPVVLRLRDTGEGCRVEIEDGRLVVSSQEVGAAANVITAESRHILVITKLRLLGKLVVGPLDRELWGLVSDVLAGRVRIKGIVRHYGNAMRFLRLVNVR